MITCLLLQPVYYFCILAEFIIRPVGEPNTRRDFRVTPVNVISFYIFLQPYSTLFFGLAVVVEYYYYFVDGIYGLQIFNL